MKHPRIDGESPTDPAPPPQSDAPRHYGFMPALLKIHWGEDKVASPSTSNAHGYHRGDTLRMQYSDPDAPHGSLMPTVVLTVRDRTIDLHLFQETVHLYCDEVPQ